MFTEQYLGAECYLISQNCGSIAMHKSGYSEHRLAETENINNWSFSNLQRSSFRECGHRSLRFLLLVDRSGT